MKKALIIATAAAAIGGSVLVYSAFAQQGPGPMSHRWRQDWRPNPADIGAFQDARIAALKGGLQLNAEQEKLWPPVEAALKDMAKKRLERVEKFRAEREKLRTERETQTTLPDPVARLRRGADYLGERSAELKRLADAVQPLYEKLDDAQKRRFAILGRMAMRPGMGQRMMRWRDRADMRDDQRDGWQHRGPMGPRFGWRNDDGPRGPMGPRFGQRDDEGPRGPMGPRMEQDRHDGRLGLRFGEPEEQL